MSTYVKFRYGVLTFGLLALLFNIWELIVGSHKTIEVLIRIVECLAGIALIYAPEFFKRFLKIGFPALIVYYYWLFLIVSVFLGTCFQLMIVIPFWDKLLHLISPMLLTAVGYGILSMLLCNGENEIHQFSPWVFLTFGLCFAGICGVFWEFWEGAWDAIGNMNLQRYLSNTGQVLVGKNALADTMGDLLTNTIGAGIMAVYSGVQVKKEKTFFSYFEIGILR